MRKIKTVFLLLSIAIIFGSYVKPEHVQKTQVVCGGFFYVNNTTAYALTEVSVHSVLSTNPVPISSIFSIPAYTTTSSNGPLLGDYQLAVVAPSTPVGGLYFRVRNKTTNELLDCLHVLSGSSATCMSLNSFPFGCAAGSIIEIEVVTTGCGR